MTISDDSDENDIEDNNDVLPSLFSAAIPRRKVTKKRVASGKYTLEDFSPASGLAARRGNQRLRLSTVIDNAFPDKKDMYAWQQYINIADELSVNDPMFLGLERGEQDESLRLAFSRYVCYVSFHLFNAKQFLGFLWWRGGPKCLEEGS